MPKHLEFLFSEELFRKTVLKLVEDNPDFIYKRPKNKCLYCQKDDKPGCLFGQALLKLGVNVDTLRSFDEGGSLTSMANPPIDMILLAYTNFSSNTVIWARNIQLKQDRDICWKDCISN